jgi:CO/xanthine dehydrogenase FAD-binding subunit
VTTFFEGSLKRVKRLLQSLDRAIGLEKKPQMQNDETYSENYPKHSEAAADSPSDSVTLQQVLDARIAVEDAREHTAHTSREAVDAMRAIKEAQLHYIEACDDLTRLEKEYHEQQEKE